MAHPQIVPIFYRNDPDAATLTSFSRWIVTSQWLQTVGADYDVGTGSMLQVVQRGDTPPTKIDDSEVASLVYAGLADGSLPRPAGGLADVLYMIYFPAQTTVTLGSGTSCVDFDGYHNSARKAGVELSYAVVTACHSANPMLTDVESREVAASHELIEAATDPLPLNRPGFRFADPGSSWFGLGGGEVGDLCARGDGQDVWRESGFVAQRVWSISAADAEHDPCVPGAAADYVNLTAQRAGVTRIPPGGHQAIALRGWASGAARGTSWSLDAESGTAMPGNATLKLSATTIKDGATVSLDVAVPATAQAGSIAVFGVFSEGRPEQLLPMYAVVGDACSKFTTCDACTAEFGCGFCASSGKCEAMASATGSAEGSCAGGSFATWAGSCPGFCACHSGSCTDCASQPGCGWCDSGQTKCVEIDHDSGQPASGSCPALDWSAVPDYCAP